MTIRQQHISSYERQESRNQKRQQNIAGWSRLIALSLENREQRGYAERGVAYLKDNNVSLEEIYDAQCFWWDRWLFDTGVQRDRERSIWCETTIKWLKTRKVNLTDKY